LACRILNLKRCLTSQEQRQRQQTKPTNQKAINHITSWPWAPPRPGWAAA
jgi:hypothetical protein